MAAVVCSPIQLISLPRLELLGALLCVRLCSFVIEQLRLSRSSSFTLWSDSEIALTWIKSNPSRWKAWVSNRVSDIHELSSPSDWRYVDTKSNPADLVTHGKSAKELLVSNLWLFGPKFLCQDNDIPIVANIEIPPNPSPTEELKATSALTNVTYEPIYDFQRRNKSFPSLIRIFAYIHRFINNVRVKVSERDKASLSFNKLDLAKSTIIKCAQRNAYFTEINNLSQGRAISSKSSIIKLTPFLDNEGF